MEHFGTSGDRSAPIDDALNFSSRWSRAMSISCVGR